MVPRKHVLNLQRSCPIRTVWFLPVTPARQCSCHHRPAGTVTYTKRTAPAISATSAISTSTATSLPRRLFPVDQTFAFHCQLHCQFRCASAYGSIELSPHSLPPGALDVDAPHLGQHRTDHTTHSGAAASYGLLRALACTTLASDDMRVLFMTASLVVFI